MAIESWILFSSIALVATISPGPAVLLVSTHSLQYGTRKTIYTILGNISGLFIISTLSVLGLGALVFYSSTAFTVLKIFGGLYLIYLGIKLWKSGFNFDSPLPGKNSHAHTTNFSRYLQGMIIAVSNPKAIAFATALFPQFIDQKQPLLPQFSLLVITFMAYSFICLYIYSRLSVSTGMRFKKSRYGKPLSRLFGSLFIGSGIGLGLSS